MKSYTSIDYRCLDCNHTQTMIVSYLTNNIVRHCKKCSSTNLIKDVL